MYTYLNFDEHERLTDWTRNSKTYTNAYDWQKRRISFTPSDVNGAYRYYDYDRSGWKVLEERREDCESDCGGYGYGTYQRSEYIWYEGAPRVVIFSTTGLAVFPYSDSEIGYILNDKQGLPRKVVDQDKNDLWAATYDEFGKVLTQSGNILMSLRYPGQVDDPEFGYYYNWHRWYDFVRGRYLSTDPMDEMGDYPYAASDPVGKIDPSGLTVGDLPIMEPASDYEVFGVTGSDSSLVISWVMDGIPDANESNSNDDRGRGGHIGNPAAGVVTAAAYYCIIHPDVCEAAAAAAAAAAVAAAAAAAAIVASEIYSAQCAAQYLEDIERCKTRPVDKRPACYNHALIRRNLCEQGNSVPPLSP